MLGKFLPFLPIAYIAADSLLKSKDLIKLMEVYKDKIKPTMPIGANVLMSKYNIPEGKILGNKLKILEELWVQNGFKISDKQIQKTMNGCLIAQLVIGLAGAIARSSTDGKAGSTLAFGVLVPLLGLGLNGLWASQFGSFTPRDQPDRQG